MDLSNIFDTAKPVVIAFGLKVLGALALYIVARVLIGFVGTLITKALERQKIEPTVIRYIASTVNVALNILLVVGILGYFGVETTSFAALLAALRANVAELQSELGIIRATVAKLCIELGIAPPGDS